MTYLNKDLARTLEQQHKRTIKGFFLKIQELNNECTLLVKRLEPHIDMNRYNTAIDYVNNYVSHTTIQNLKFTTNLQNLEVLVLHIILIEYILEKETIQSFEYEKRLLGEYKEQSMILNDHAPTLYNNHRKKMLDFITL